MFLLRLRCRLRNLAGGGFTETVRHVWLRHRWWAGATIQGLPAPRRPGHPQPGGRPRALAAAAAALRVELPHLAVPPGPHRALAHLQDAAGGEPLPRREEWRGGAAPRQLPGGAGGPPVGLRRLRRSAGFRLPVLGGPGEGGGLEGVQDPAAWAPGRGLQELRARIVTAVQRSLSHHHQILLPTLRKARE